MRAGRGTAFALFAMLVVCFSASAATIVGTTRADTLRGTPGADRLKGRQGDDRLYGFAGNDMLDGGAGHDQLFGGPGDDRIVTRDHTADVIRCGPGRDTAIVDEHDVVQACEDVRGLAPAPQPNPISLENLKPGNADWGRAERATGRAIEAYAQPTIVPGQTLAFHVSTSPAATYRIDLYRMGYYGGAGARLVACLPSCDGSASAVTEPIPPATRDGLVHAGWPVSQSLVVPPDWQSGYYYAAVTLTSGPQAGSSHPVWVIVREAPGARRAPILVQAATTTWQAYNGWGGGGAYGFNSPHGIHAAKFAFDRPYDATSPAWPAGWELPLVRFLERMGYDVDYQGDVDTAREPSTLDGRRLIVVAGHGEYWSKETRDAFDRARDSGTSLSFMGSNAAYWQVRYEDDFTTIVSYKSAVADPEADPALDTVQFRALVPPRNECALIGIQHQGGKLDWTTDGDYTATSAALDDPWLRAGGIKPGDVFRGIVSREVDAVPWTETGGYSCGNKITVLFNRSLGGNYSGDADSVKYTAPSGARVFASGSHQFVWGLEDIPQAAMGHGLVDERLRRFTVGMLDDLSKAARYPPPQ